MNATDIRGYFQETLTVLSSIRISSKKGYSLFRKLKVPGRILSLNVVRKQRIFIVIFKKSRRCSVLLNFIEDTLLIVCLGTKRVRNFSSETPVEERKSLFNVVRRQRIFFVIFKKR